MKEYYAREDVLHFLYDESQMRNIDIAFRRKRWPVNPTSKTHLGEIIKETIENKIERAYRGTAEPLDNIRLEKCDYLSFHFQTAITQDKKLVGFDMTFEADLQGWRRAFEDLIGVIKLLDDFEVCYRIKYSGVRSLHFMIPFEALPKQFNGESVLSQRTKIQSQIKDYFRRHCGMEKAHAGSVLRLAYSLNEDNGLVSLPISPDELYSFRPWETNLYNVTIDKPWHGDIPAGASKKMLKFLREVYNDDAKAKGEKKISFALEIAPKERSICLARSGEDSMAEWAARLKSEAEANRVEAAWRLMTISEAVPISILQESLADGNPDVRWYLTEALQKNLNEEAIKIAGKMLWDEDQFVRISAIDALTLSGERALQVVLSSLSGEIAALIGPLNDVVYAIRKICPEGESDAIRACLESNRKSVALSLQNAINSDVPLWKIRGYVRQLRNLCQRYGVLESVLFQEAIKMLVPQLLDSISKGELGYRKLWFLQEMRRNQAIPRLTLREIADSLDIDAVKIPSNRMAEEERAFLTQVVRGALDHTMLAQKARILYAFLRRYPKKLSEPAKNLLQHIKHINSSVAESITKWMDGASTQAFGASDQLAQEKSIDELIEMLGQSWSVRTAAAYALAEKCNRDEDVEKVIGALNQQNTKARVAAVKALGAMSHPLARQAVVKSLNASRGGLK